MFRLSRQHVRLSVLALMVGSALVATSQPARAQPPDPTTQDQLTAMQGVWISKDATGETVWTFKDNLLEIDSPGRDYKFRITLNALAKPHKHLDFEALEDSPSSPGAKSLGIYKFDGPQKLFICFAVPGGRRPEAFVNGEMFETFVFELTPRPN